MKAWSQDWLIAAGAYLRFCSMKPLARSTSTSPGWDASPLQVTSPQFVRFPPTIGPYPFIQLAGERYCGNKVSCPRTQHNIPSQGSNLDSSLRFALTNHEATTPSAIRGLISKYQNGMPKVARKALYIGEVWTPVCCHGNKTL